MEADKAKALEAALGQIERQFGKGTVMRMGDNNRQSIPSISTGSLGLDIALGIGGLPKGRIVEIYMVQSPPVKNDTDTSSDCRSSEGWRYLCFC